MSTDLTTGTGARQRSAGSPSGLLLRMTGTGLLWAAAGMHLDLYMTGYRTIPTIGPLFMFQVIAGLVLGLLVLLTRSRLAAAAGALFALSTLGGYLLSVQFGLFGFREVRTTAGIVAGIIEVAAFAVLAAYTVLGGVPGLAEMPGTAGGRHSGSRHGVSRPAGSRPGGQDRGLLDRGIPAAAAFAGVAAVVVVALGLMGGAVAGAGGGAGTGGGSQTTAGSALRTTIIGGVSVLTNASGRTLYWFAPDTSSKSVCNGSCAAYWPPVHGPLTAGAGVTGKLGTIRRDDGSTQETYNGHPLYTYIGDSGPGQAHGNDLNLNGGLWHEVTVSG